MYSFAVLIWSKLCGCHVLDQFSVSSVFNFTSYPTTSKKERKYRMQITIAIITSQLKKDGLKWFKHSEHKAVSGWVMLSACFNDGH